MKTRRLLFLLMMMTAVLLKGTSLAAQANPASQQAPSQSSEKSASDHPSDVQRDVQKDGEIRGGKDPTRSGKADENQQPSSGLARRTTKHRPTTSDSNPISSHQLRLGKTPSTNSPRTDTSESVATLQQRGSKVAIAVSNKAVSHRNPYVPPSAVSVNGQQLKNSCDPGARLAVSGGPLIATKGTAAINGTNMERKP